MSLNMLLWTKFSYGICWTGSQLALDRISPRRTRLEQIVVVGMINKHNSRRKNAGFLL